MLVLGLATGNKIALATMGAIFIAFALVSAFVLPRRNPEFPGRGLWWFVLASIVLFLAMITAVLVFGVEEKEAEGGSGKKHETPSKIDTTTNAEATTTEAGETATSGGGGGEAAAGDAAAGKKVFETAGCTGCHTLKAANATGTVGPNLDDAKPDRDLIRDRVEHGKGPMPSFKGQLSDEQIDDVVAFVYDATHS